MWRLAQILGIIFPLIGCSAPASNSQNDYSQILDPRLPDNVAEATTTYTINLHSVHFLRCDGRTGTAETIGQNTLLTAEHVVGDSTTCTVNDRPVTITAKDEELDYAVLDYASEPRSQKFPISCEGFITGREYFAIGYAHGLDFVITKGVATARFDNTKHLRILSGRAYSGMSGGPIVDVNGVQVGIVVARTLGSGPQFMYARELKETDLCLKHLE